MARNENGKGFSLKDHLFNEEKVTFLAAQFKAADSSFDEVGFVGAVMKDLAKLELKERIVLIAITLEQHLDSDFAVAATQIVAALPPELDPKKTDDDFGDFIMAPLGEYVVRNGLSKKHLKTSLRTLRELTKRFSMEDAIRYFINEFPEETFSELEKWTTDKNYHVRRLVSEGARALLPWSGRLVTDYTRPLPLLDVLHADKTRYVTRSVANHLNDIAKRDPQLVVRTLKRWQKENKQDPKELDWMTRHALRTLLKRGDQQALALLGYRAKPKITVSELTLDATKLQIGETLTFTATISAACDEQLMVDYVLDFMKANGTTAPKVFKLKKLAIKKGETITLTKKHRFLADATTFTVFPGKHTVRLQINGVQYTPQTFTLSKAT